MILSVYLDNLDVALASHKLQEAINLAKSLNIIVLHSEFLKLRNPSPGNFLSTGHLLKFKEIIDQEGGFIRAHWNGTREVEDLIKNETKATIRCIPLNDQPEAGKCILTGEHSQQEVIFAIAY